MPASLYAGRILFLCGYLLAGGQTSPNFKRRPVMPDGVRCIIRLYAGIGAETAVDRDNDSGDKSGRVIVEQVQQGAAQLLGFAEAVHRRLGKNFGRAGRGVALWVKQQRLILLGDEEAGCDGVDPNASTRKMHRKPLGEVADRRLGRAVCRNLGQRGIRIH